MKQIILKPTSPDAPACSGKLFWLWGCYGLALALLWQLAGASRAGEAIVWSVAVLAGLALALALREV
jgi:hypothetical protein